MEKIVLPINVNPPITGYLHHAYPLSILSTHEAYVPWFFSNYIQIYSHDTGPRPYINFFIHAAYPLLVSPLLNVQWLDRYTALNTRNGVIQFMTESLDRGYYIQPHIDEFYLPDRGAFGIEHFIHEILIFGYDSLEKTFSTLGYNKNGQFAVAEVAFEDLETSFNEFEHHLPQTDPDFYFKDKIWLAKYDTDRTYKFDIDLVIEQFEDFLLSKNTAERFRMINNPEEVGIYRQKREGLHGVESYKNLEKFLHSLLAGSEVRTPIPFHNLWEHKNVMRARIEYMENQGLVNPAFRLSEEFQDVEKAARTLRMMYLKYEVKGDDNLVERMLGHFDKMKQKEIDLLQKTLDELKEYRKHTSLAQEPEPVEASVHMAG